MHRTKEHDPVALFEFAISERDWVLADMIASLLLSETSVAVALRRSTARAAGTGPAPGSLRELAGWARMARTLGIGDG